jgi:hypothetical protein
MSRTIGEIGPARNDETERPRDETGFLGRRRDTEIKPAYALRAIKIFKDEAYSLCSSQ